MTFIKVIP